MNHHNIVFFRHNFNLEENAPEEIYKDLCENILSSCGGVPLSKKTAIYLFTPDAGAYYSVRLWENALEHGPAFANPKNFAWTLASGPASFLAQLLRAQGPNTTLIGGTENLSEIMDLITWHTSHGLLEAAIIIQLQHNDNSDIKLNSFCRGAVLAINGETSIDNCFNDILQFFSGTSEPFI